MTARPEQPSWAQLGAMAAATAGWLLLARYALPVGASLAPVALQKAISWSTFRALAQVVTLGAGLGLWAALAGGLRRLDLRPPSARQWGSVLMAWPVVWVGATAIGLAVAMPTLMEELATRGPGASRQNAGAFGRELTGSSLGEVLLTGVVLAATSEELLFRGALWSTTQALLGRLVGHPEVNDELGPTAGQRAQAWLLRGWGATLVAGLVFGAMHNDVPGGVGIVRVVSTTCLGLASGAVRTLTGSLLASVALHALHNTLSVAHTRGYFAGQGNLYGVPYAVLAGAVLGGIGLVALRAAARRQTTGGAEPPAGA